MRTSIRFSSWRSAGGSGRCTTSLSLRSCEGTWCKPCPTHQVDSQAACNECSMQQARHNTEKGMLAWVFAPCEQGIIVTKAQVVFKASTDIHSFGAKSFEAHFKAVGRFFRVTRLHLLHENKQGYASTAESVSAGVRLPRDHSSCPRWSPPR
jgi:hypothetical protein